MKHHYARFNLVLISAGLSRPSCIRVLREIVPNFGLKESLDFVNQEMPAVVLTNLTDWAVKKCRRKLEAVGASAKQRGIGSVRKFKQGVKSERIQS